MTNIIIRAMGASLARIMLACFVIGAGCALGVYFLIHWIVK